MAKLFISYRREDSQYQADRLHAAIAPHMDDPRRDIFLDIDNIPLGVNFAAFLDEKVSQCAVLLALIGPGWLEARDETGQRRLDSAEDFVRIEIASALKRGIPVVPVLLDGAPVPRADELPEDLKELALRNGTAIQRDTFESDAVRLVRGLGLAEAERVDGPARATPAGGRGRRRLALIAGAGLAVALGAFAVQSGFWDWGEADYSPAPAEREEAGTGPAGDTALGSGALYEAVGREDDGDGLSDIVSGESTGTAPTAPPPRAGETWRETLLLRPGEGDKCGVDSAVFSPDGRFILSDGQSQTRASNGAHLFDRAGQARRSFTGHDSCLTSVAFSPDGARIVTASGDDTARVWDAASGRVLARLEGHEVNVTSAAFSPDGARIVTASWDDTARVWDAASGQTLTRLEGHENNVYSAAFSPDGSRIVTASRDDTARVWDAASGRELAGLEGHEGDVRSAAFSPDGSRIVTASWDDTARVWDAASGQELTRLEGHGDNVTSAAFSPDGARIVTASLDKTARVWDSASGRELTRLEGHGSSVRSAAFSPDGRAIVTTSHDGTVRVWELE
jgi:WD40 repeat protein